MTIVVIAAFIAAAIVVVIELATKMYRRLARRRLCGKVTRFVPQ